jgi:hypothetical protein
MTTTLPFPRAPIARANLKPGTLYAVDGGDSFIYYGQVAPNKQLGFFQFRSQALSADEALSSPLMSRFIVSLPSIGRALRAGVWVSLGHRKLRSELAKEPVFVQWPVGTLEVTLWKGGKILKTTQVHDPEIQELEIIAAYDAVFHVPSRLRADFAEPDDAWLVGGSIWRERRKKQELASRHPEQPWLKLPAQWVSV